MCSRIQSTALRIRVELAYRKVHYVCETYLIPPLQDASIATLATKDVLPVLTALADTDLSNFLSDTIHPTAEAQPKVLDHVWPALVPLLD